MKLMLGCIALIGSFLATSHPVVLGPDAYPTAGAVLDAFPDRVYAWHNRNGETGKPITDLHKSSHMMLKGPDGLWLDGTVHVGDRVYFIPDFPERLGKGIYKVSTTANWMDGIGGEEYSWEFTVKE